MLLISRRVVIIGFVILLRASTGVRAGYQVTNLVSDVAGLAKITDHDLKNPWGVSSPPNGPFWVSDQANNTATLYSGSGSPLSLIVSIPTVNGAPKWLRLAAIPDRLDSDRERRTEVAPARRYP
jgi:hypothetical protein